MKTSDWISMGAIAIIAAIVAVWLSNMLLGNPEEATYSYKTATAISSSVAEPDTDIFNVNAINPSVEIIVGDCDDSDGDGAITAVDIRACNEQYED